MRRQAPLLNLLLHFGGFVSGGCFSSTDNRIRNILSCIGVLFVAFSFLNLDNST